MAEGKKPAKTKSVLSGVSYAEVNDETGRVIARRFIAPVVNDDGETQRVKISVRAGCTLYELPFGESSIVSGKLAKDVPVLKAIIDAEAAKKAEAAVAKKEAEEAKKAEAAAAEKDGASDAK